MHQPSRLALVALAALALSGALAGAHARNYTVAPSLFTCIDKDFNRLVAGAVGGAVNGAIDTADPLAPDNGGSCYRPGHITPNVNGDVTFTASDAVATNVGVCVTQDSDDDGGFCNDAGDDEERSGCNSVTVNASDGYDFANKETLIGIRELPWGSGTVAFLIGDLTYCQLGIDDYGTTGNVNHS